MSVDQPTWEAFKKTVGAGGAIGQVLGDLVTSHVHRHQALKARDGQLEDRQLLDALDRAQQLQHDLSYLVLRIEDRLGRPPPQPAANPSPAAPTPLPFPER